MSPDETIQKTVEKLTPKETKDALQRLDHPTLQAAAGIAAQMGFQHFRLSQDTRISLEARKAHRFVAVNCEELTKKILRLTGAPEPAVEEMKNGIAAQVMAFMEKNERGANLQ